jgi:hypothetical protein
MLTAILTISTTVVVLSSLGSNVYAIRANTTDFSVNVSDNWAYKLDADNALANALLKGLDVGSTLTLIPTEFSDFLVNTSKDISGQTSYSDSLDALRLALKDYQ